MKLASRCFRWCSLHVFVLIAFASCFASAQDVIEWKVRTPLVLVPCGRGVDKCLRDKLYVVTSNLHEIVHYSSTYADSDSSNAWAVAIHVVCDMDITGYRESTNRLDYVDVASFFTALTNAAPVIAEKNAEESIKMLAVAFDAAVPLDWHRRHQRPLCQGRLTNQALPCRLSATD